MALLYRPAALAAFTLLSLTITLGASSAANAQTMSPAPVQPPTPYATPTPMITPVPTVTPVPTSSASPSPAGQMEAASPSPIATTVNPPENTLITQRVRDAFLAWQRGHVDRKTYSAYAGGTYEHAYVAIVSPLLAIGPPQTLTYQTATLLLGDLVYRYDVTGTSGDVVSVLYSLNQNGRTDGIVFTPQIFRSGTKTQ